MSIGSQEGNDTSGNNDKPEEDEGLNNFKADNVSKNPAPKPEPKTGDVSLLGVALSGLSAGGMAVLNRKRKEEE